MCAQIGWLTSFRYAVHISKCPFRHVYIFLLIFCFFQACLELSSGMQTSLAATEDNSEGIRRIVITGTIITLVVVIFGGLVFVWMRIGCCALAFCWRDVFVLRGGNTPEQSHASFQFVKG